MAAGKAANDIAFLLSEEWSCTVVEGNVQVTNSARHYSIRKCKKI